MVLAVACAGGDGEQAEELPRCPIGALDDASAEGPVEIVFWHAMTAQQDALAQLTDQFNRSQDRVRVELVDNTTYEAQQERYRDGLESGELPDLVQHQEIWLRQMIDTQSALPVQSCIDETGADTSDFVPPMLRYYEVDGVQWGLPFNVETPILLYNRAAFERAGLDPVDPPETLDELREAAQALKDGGFDAGMSLKVDGWYLEQLIALQGETLANNGNGRDGRATEVTFESEAGLEVFDYLAEMVDEGLAVTSPRDGPGQFDNLLGVGAGRWGMTVDSSANLGTILGILAGGSGQYANVDLAVGPMPGRTEDGGVLVGGGALYISAIDDAKQAAAWEYLSFLTSAETQATWSAATGYLPVRQSATGMPEIEERWGAVPGFQIAYDQLLERPENSATAGAVMGDLSTVRTLFEEAESRMFDQDQAQDPAEALAEAAEAANEIVDDYNDRVG